MSTHSSRTISRLLNVHTLFLDALDNGIVAAGKHAQQILYDASDTNDADINEDERYIFDQLGNLSESYDIDDFNIDLLREDIQHDITVLKQILEPVKEIYSRERCQTSETNTITQVHLH